MRRELLNNMAALAAVLICLPATPGVQADENPPAHTPIIQELSPGIFAIGKLRLDRNSTTITFPGSINMDKGALEYLIVTPKGATHESLLVADIQPTDLHFAMLLLGAKGAGLSTPAAKDAPPAQIDQEYLKNAPKLKGDTLKLTATWKHEGKEKTAPIEDWVAHAETGKPLERGPWIYTGSIFSGKHFMAQVEGLFAALVVNPSALINNPRLGNDNDQIWIVNQKTVPPAGTSVEIIIKLENTITESK